MAQPQPHLDWYAEHGEDVDRDETEEWLQALDDVVASHGGERAQYLLTKLLERGYERGVHLPFTANTPYVNTIPCGEQPSYPGDRQIERRIKSLLRWNAMAMVVRANKYHDGIGGHIATYASAATLYEVGFHHFFRGRGESGFGHDLIYFQGHASPGIYARAYLEGRLDERQLQNFRRELEPGGGLSSYPHPWLMPDFWEFPTVSMGLGPIQAIYQARFNKYLHNRGLADTSQRKVWAFLGDGETDEPESLGAITLAAREKLDNLIFVVNCNLQRLDGPVRGNGKIIQELETIFRGAGWRVIKVIWGDDWDPLLEADSSGLLVKRMNEVVDGQYQKYTVEPGAYIRQDFFGKYPELLPLVEHYSDDQLARLRRGGHDPAKVYAAYAAAVRSVDCPTVILAKTVKGYGMGEAGEGRNPTHQQKKLNEAQMRQFRDRFEIPVSDNDLGSIPFYRPPADSPEAQYLRERREKLGGFLPERRTQVHVVPTPERDHFAEFFTAVDRDVSTTMVFVQILRALLKHPELGKKIVPIVPDEARTFGMESLFRSYGIYASQGQLYEPVDVKMLLSYHEAQNGQILEEGITEAGSMASFIAAGTAYATHGLHTIPFFIFYSMFGFQRVGDLIWAFGDQRGRGFLMGATAGRTTLNGEGLQHEDGHSHILANTVPNCMAYDPAYHYELATIIRDGIQRMYGEKKEPIFYYITLYNENYPQLAMPEGSEEGILKGLYLLRRGEGDAKKKAARVQLLGSGSLLREALRAQEILASELNVTADVWSATSYKALRYEAMACDRWNLLHPGETPKVPYVTQVLGEAQGPVVAVSDFMRLVPDQIARWVPQGLTPLGTDGYGRSDTRKALRRFFEVDAESVAFAALAELAKRGVIDAARAREAQQKLGIDPEKVFALLS
ncbi:MAG TPA: pyruvate dehydrogenase (acetyl-transferring), homodimeric type [Thermoanaerobaculia bacterium]|jgi:pyruvate dehydrogenase E1 component|nr:pyruvate dehydrogenase (acetyl-transferring), homodimeric type [Thermoanaerobaculia bacterium]